MAISYIGRSFTGYGSRANTTLSGTLDTGSIQDDDALVAATITAAGGEAPDPTLPSGFSLIGTMIEVTDGGFNLEHRVSIKRALSESGSYTWTHSSASAQGVLLVLRGVDWATGPLDADSTSATGTGGTTTIPGLTTVTPGTMLVLFAFDWANSSNNLTPPSGMTERYDATLSYAATQEIASPGSTGSKVYTNNTGAGVNPWGGRLIALRPAGAAPKSLIMPQPQQLYMPHLVR